MSQVNTSGEANKNGLEPKEAVAAAEFIEQRWKCVIVCLWLEARVLILESLENKHRFQMSQFFGNILEFLATPQTFQSPAAPTWSWPVWWRLEIWETARLLPLRWVGVWTKTCVTISKFFLATTIFVNAPSKKKFQYNKNNCQRLKHFPKGDNPDFRTLLQTRGAVAAALGKVRTDNPDGDENFDGDPFVLNPAVVQIYWHAH